MTDSNSESSSAIAAFDFDGTITTKDTTVEFLRFLKGNFGLYLGFGLNSFRLAGFYLGLTEREKAKLGFIHSFIGGRKVADLNEAGIRFAKEIVPRFYRPEAMKRLDWHREQSHEIVIVSASFDFWLKPWCEEQGLQLISTKVNQENGIVVRGFDGGNCRGPEKVRRLEERFDMSMFDKKYAYGDSEGDKEMLAWADEAHFRPFR